MTYALVWSQAQGEWIALHEQIWEHRKWVSDIPARQRNQASIAFAAELVRAGLCRRALADSPCLNHAQRRCRHCYRSDLSLEFR